MSIRQSLSNHRLSGSDVREPGHGCPSVCSRNSLRRLIRMVGAPSLPGGPTTCSWPRLVLAILLVVTPSAGRLPLLFAADAEESRARAARGQECVPAIQPAADHTRRPQQQPPATNSATRPRPVPNCLSLFDGKTLNGWKSTPFGGEGDVYVKDGQIILETGADLTGITWTEPELLPTINYEVELDAMRVDGSDFFCGLTFPVGKHPCTLILGGWGGGVCGLSSLDGFDASENETTTYKEFKNKRWYHVRLRVTPERITAWLDNEEMVDVDTRKRQIGIRPEVDLSRPFGIASWQTTAALKNIVVRRLPVGRRPDGAAAAKSPEK